MNEIKGENYAVFCFAGKRIFIIIFYDRSGAPREDKTGVEDTKLSTNKQHSLSDGPRGTE